MQGGFVPVGYDLYGQAAPFAGAGMDGLSAGAPGAAHPLVPYLQGARIPGAAGAGKRQSGGCRKRDGRGGGANFTLVGL